jgi:hypothetical protein
VVDAVDQGFGGHEGSGVGGHSGSMPSATRKRDTML